MNLPARWLVSGGWLVVLFAGCSTRHTYHAGDAIIHEKRVHFSVLASASRFYRVELPRVPLSVAGDYRFSVRGSPQAIQLTHLLMSLPSGDVHHDKKSESVLPWEHTILSLSFTQPGGVLIYSNRFCLGELNWSFSQGDLKLKPWHHADRIVGWYAWSDLKELQDRLGLRSDYDVVVSVERPSPRKRDAIQLRGENGGLEISNK